jgi:hypothetical protein
MSPKRLSYFLVCFGLAGSLIAGDNPAAAADDSAPTRTTSTPAPANPDMEVLKKILADQQRQIDELRRQLAGQGKAAPAGATPAPAPASAATATSAAPATAPSTSPATTSATAHASSGAVATTAPIVPPSPVAPPPAFPPVNPSSSSASSASSATAQGADNVASSPLQLKIGDAYITPVGFLDMTSVTRSTNTGNGIGTNFGSIPYGNTQTGSLSETRFSPQNSRIGARVDAVYKGAKIIGYWESDFLGQTGNPPNGGIAVSSNPYVFRLRLYWVDVRKGKFEFLAGQTWSLLTPNRYGLSPLPGDVFYSQDMDVNYQAGLVWGRIPAYRFVFHPTEKIAWGLELDNSEPYVGGGNGGSAITAPACCSTLLGTQVNNGSSVLSAAALMPDIISKIAFDPSRKFHLEVAGVLIANKIANPATTPADQTFTNVGGGGSLNLNFDLMKNVRLITNNFISDGGGRYIFGQAPDFIIRSNGSLSNVHSGSTASGFEITAGKTLIYTYYGGVYIGQDLAIDTNGSKIGYGAISSDGQNRAIQEFTVGTNTTIWQDPKWGALNIITQYSYLERNPWLAAVGAPDNAHLNMGFFDFRYTLPGAPPSLPKQ